MKKGKIPWNKGVPMTEEQKDKLRKAGRWFKGGSTAWNKGMTYSSDRTQKMSETTKQLWGRQDWRDKQVQKHSSPEYIDTNKESCYAHSVSR